MRRILFLLVFFWVGCQPKIDPTLFSPRAPKPIYTDAHIYDQTSPPAKDLAARIEEAFRRELKKNKQLQYTSTALADERREILQLARERAVQGLERGALGDLDLWRETFSLDFLIFGVFKGSDYSQILDLYAVDLKERRLASRVQIFFLLEEQSTDQDLAELAARELQQIISAHQ